MGGMGGMGGWYIQTRMKTHRLGYTFPIVTNVHTYVQPYVSCMYTSMTMHALIRTSTNSHVHAKEGEKEHIAIRQLWNQAPCCCPNGKKDIATTRCNESPVSSKQHIHPYDDPNVSMKR